MNEYNEFSQPLNFTVDNWKPALKPSNKLLKGRYCSVVPFDIKKHSKDVFESLQVDNLGESWTYLPYGPFETLNQFCEWVESTSSESDTKLYAILNANNIPVGVAGYLRINPEHGVIEVGHLHFSKLMQKSVIATEAMYLMMKYAFDDLKYRRYEWKCNSLNEASQKAAKRLGFKFEGIFRQSHVLKNRNRDTAWFSILDKEWTALKQKFEAWLNPNNFDPKGCQIKTLNDF